MAAKLFATGWDIGGAHLKVTGVDAQGKILFTEQYMTPVWLGLESLSLSIDSALIRLKQYAQDNCSQVITMTAELADGFPDRDTGVKSIAKLIKKKLSPYPVYFYAIDKGFIPYEDIDQCTELVSSANWHASANYIASLFDTGVMIDMGTTTTDIIPFGNGNVLTESISDYDRLTAGELVYTGMVRTPVFSVIDQFEYLGKTTPLMAEQFASMADVYRILNMLNEHDDMYDTADGEKKSIHTSMVRLMRMVGIDNQQHISLHQDEIIALCEEIMRAQIERINQAVQNAIEKICKGEKTILVLIGSGADILKTLPIAKMIPALKLSNYLDLHVQNKPLSENFLSSFCLVNLFLRTHEA